MIAMSNLKQMYGNDQITATEIRKNDVQFIVIIPIAKVMIPLRMDHNPFHSNVLLAAFNLIHVVFTCHHSVLTGV